MYRFSDRPPTGIRHFSSIGSSASVPGRPDGPMHQITLFVNFDAHVAPPLYLRVLLSPTHRYSALRLLGRFVSLGPWVRYFRHRIVLFVVLAVHPALFFIFFLNHRSSYRRPTGIRHCYCWDALSPSVPGLSARS